MEVHGEDGVLVSLLGRMGWVYGRILGEVGRSSVVIPDLRWKIAPRLDSGMVFGVGMWPLRIPFQYLFIYIACAMDASVAAHVEFSRCAIQWNVSFARGAQDWGVGPFASFFWLYLIRMRREAEDKLWWVPFKRGLLGVKSFYKFMGCHDGFRFPWKIVWRTKILLMVAFFVWSVAIGKILTIDNLRKWLVVVVDRCCMCKKIGEFVDHLLLHFEVVYTICNIFFNRFGCCLWLCIDE
jgi:hypothetical protein